ncbi:hypothetical protein ENBRE01_1734 [Enteropsectra breve]|nr:hypothetical protein ENBRE01_1734 [Enteropsectra breve]
MVKSFNQVTHGDNEETNLIECLKISGLRLNNESIKKRYNGCNGLTASEFISQWEEKEVSEGGTEIYALNEIKLSLEGKVLSWFNGARNKFFKDWKTFKQEFLEMFEENDRKGSQSKLISVLNNGLRMGALKSGLLEIFELNAKLNLNLKYILEISTRNLKSRYKK